MSWTDAFRSIDELPPLGPADVDPRRSIAYDEARRDGFAVGVTEGRSRGEALGRSEGAAQVLADARSGLDALVAAAADLRARDAAALATMQDHALDLALGIAEAVIGREIDTAIDPGRDALARALAVAPTSNEPIEARLHPEDLAALGGVEDLLAGRELRLVADPSVGRGGCFVDIGATQVDARVDTAIARVRAELGGAA